MRSENTLEFVAKQLVDHPDDVRVETVEEDRQTVLNLYVHDDDLGKVIGKHGGLGSVSIQTACEPLRIA